MRRQLNRNHNNKNYDNDAEPLYLPFNTNNIMTQQQIDLLSTPRSTAMSTPISTPAKKSSNKPSSFVLKPNPRNVYPPTPPRGAYDEKLRNKLKKGFLPKVCLDQYPPPFQHEINYLKLEKRKFSNSKKKSKHTFNGIQSMLKFCSVQFNCCTIYVCI